MTSVMIRVAINQDEWAALRAWSHESGVPVTKIVARLIRESLPKGGKP